MVLDIDYLILDYRFSIVIPRPPPTNAQYTLWLSSSAVALGHLDIARSIVGRRLLQHVYKMIPR